MSVPACATHPDPRTRVQIARGAGRCQLFRKGKAPRRASYALAEIPPDLNAELNALEQWRVSPINMSRKGVAVAEITAGTQRQNVVRLLGWLVHEGKLARPTLTAFASVQIGAAV